MSAVGRSHEGRVLGGRYQVGERIGEGAWGAVYTALQQDLGRRVAIKILHEDVALTHEGLSRFEQEARAVAALGHPNIVQVTDFQARQGEPAFFVMELLTGTTVGALLRREGRLPAARVARIAQQVLGALDAAHQAGITHRDVKPDNVFLVAASGVEDFVKLLDFGVAKLSGASQDQFRTTGSSPGSPAFMAPEQARGGPIDARVDIYALGATMYLALCGRFPYDAPNLLALVHAICEGPPPPHVATIDPSIDPRVAAVVMRALEKDPAARFGSAADMRAALAAPSALASTSGAPPAFASGPPPMHPAYPSGPPPMVAPPQPMIMMPPAMAQTQPAAGGGIKVLLIAIVAALVVLAGVAVIGLFLYMGKDHSVTITSTTPDAGAGALSAPTSTIPTAPTTPTSTAAATVPAGPTATLASTSVSPKPGPARDAGAGNLASIDAGAPTPILEKKQMAGTKPQIGGGTFNTYDIEKSKAAINAQIAAITQCYVMTEFEAPDHQFTAWVFTNDAAGNVTSVKRATDYQLHPKFDACMMTALRRIKWGPMPGGGAAQVQFTARTRDNP